MADTIDTLYFYSIPVTIEQQPPTGAYFRTLFLRTRYRDLLAIPNGMLLAFIGKYTPGTRQSFFPQRDGIDLIAVRDFSVLDVYEYPPIHAVVTGDAGEVLFSTSYDYDIFRLPLGYWDLLVLVLNLRPGYSWPVDLMNQVESARASLIVQDAFGIVSA